MDRIFSPIARPQYKRKNRSTDVDAGERYLSVRQVASYIIQCNRHSFGRPAIDGASYATIVDPFNSPRRVSSASLTGAVVHLPM
jgi:hypothetical protein